MVTLADAQLLGIRRGIEKESLRALPDGTLAMTPHSLALGSALTHPSITTDYSESQLELITGVHATPEQALRELTDVHQAVYAVLAAEGQERLWVSSMPCGLPTDETIPIGRYGNSNIGRAKSIYRVGLGQRYGRRMQTISGIHYNWSLPGVSSEQYFSLIRNFRRHSFLLLYLFGASPALCSSFVAGRRHELLPLGCNGQVHTFHMPHATSLRMGRLGYQSDAQALLAVSYNNLDSYAASLEGALTHVYAPYEAIGVRNPGGDYNQLSTSLLQIENEFYGTIRPKRVIRPGERPLHALRERGVEYVEVRCMDLDPFEPVGINAQTMRFLDVFLLHCLTSDSPPDTPEEIAALSRNQHRVAARGREKDLQLEYGTRTRSLADWGAEVLRECEPMAAALDAAHGSSAYGEALMEARRRLIKPETTPSARVLEAMKQEYCSSHVGFVRARSEMTRAFIRSLPHAAGLDEHYARLARESLAAQQRIEDEDTLDFEEFLERYVAPEALEL
ncbi:MAG: glutamate--cysteine ligase [Paucibacter sp.]|nr:glutamate--cysteine ligase [Roseateles sp.]